MPAIFDTQYAQWLTQHGDPRAIGVHVLEFSHSAFGGSEFVSSYGEDFAATTEDGVDFVAQPLGFQFDVAADNVSTEQRIMIRLDNANGLVTSKLRALTLDDLQEAVIVTARDYLDTKRDAPSFDPLVLKCTQVRATRLTVEVEASADQLPNVTSGTRYTLDVFPPLAFI